MAVADEGRERVADLLGDLQDKRRIEAGEEQGAQPAVGVPVAGPDRGVLAEAEQAFESLEGEEVVDNHHTRAALKVKLFGAPTVPGRRQRPPDPRSVGDVDQAREGATERPLVLGRERGARICAEARQSLNSRFIGGDDLLERCAANAVPAKMLELVEV